MHPHLKSLIELQAVDLRLIGIRERLSRFPKRLAEVEARVTAAKQQVAAAKESLLTGQKERKTYEMDVEQWKERAKKYRGQSGEVKSNEAYKALLHEIQNAEDEVAKAEDRLLERMVSGEEYDRQVKAAEAAVKVVEAAAAKDRQTIQAEYNAAQRNCRPRKLCAPQPWPLFPKIWSAITNASPSATGASRWRKSAAKGAASAACTSARM